MRCRLLVPGGCRADRPRCTILASARDGVPPLPFAFLANSVSASQVNLNLESKAAHSRKAQRKTLEGAKGGRARQKTGHAFSADNPYGRQALGDKRQFVRI